MLALGVALFVIAVVGAVVVAAVAGPARGRRVPGVENLRERVSRAMPDDDPSPAYGVLSSPEGARRAQHRFERAEHAVQQAVARLSHPGRHRD